MYNILFLKVIAAKKYLLISNLRANVSDSGEKVNFQFDAEESFSILVNKFDIHIFFVY